MIFKNCIYYPARILNTKLYETISQASNVYSMIWIVGCQQCENNKGKRFSGTLFMFQVSISKEMKGIEFHALLMRRNLSLRKMAEVNKEMMAVPSNKSRFYRYNRWFKKYFLSSKVTHLSTKF